MAITGSSCEHTGADQASSVKDQYASTRVGIRQLHGAEAFWRKVGAGAATGDKVEVERERLSSTGHRDGFGQLYTHTRARSAGEKAAKVAAFK